MKLKMSILGQPAEPKMTKKDRNCLDCVCQTFFLCSSTVEVNGSTDAL